VQGELDANHYMSRVNDVRRNRPLSAQAISVLRALAADLSRWRYGYDLGTEVHLKSGSLYPILVRLADRGLLEATWEPGPEGRPPRHLYRLSEAGREYAAALPPSRVPQTVPSLKPRLSEA
jgi:PadR family transcriptional regulator, regulatory protein PadR